MHQLKALIWKAYKVRLRSPFSTALDVAGPIVTIMIYLVLKVFMGALSVPSVTNSTSDIFSRPIGATIEPSRDLSQYLCNKILFFTSDQANGTVRQRIGERCGAELVPISSENELVDRLHSSLSKRINYTQVDTNLNFSNASRARCFALPDGSEPSYQAGIVLENGRAQVYMTESTDNPIIHQPYTQGSTFNEYRFPQSDLNSGYHLLEICLNEALNTRFPRSRERRQIENNGTTQSRSNLKWRIRAFPEISTPSIVIFVFMSFQLAANYCNATSTVMRIADENESGLHRYIRSAGVSASVYWSAHMIAMAFHMVVQSLILAILLTIPTSNVLCDPIFETNLIYRWLLLLTYSLAINAHAMFVGSMFSRTSHAILVTCLLAVAYAMYPLFFMLQWSPYAFSSHTYLAHFFTLSNPVSNYQALLIVIYSVYVQTNKPLALEHLPMGIIGGGLSDWSIGALWLALVAQAIIWFLATILFDQWRYSTRKYSFLCFPLDIIHEIFFCNQCGPEIKDNDELEQSKIAMKAKTTESPSAATVGYKSTKSGKSQKDPNRICCSLRNFYVYGPSIMVAYTKSDPLKLVNVQASQSHHPGQENISRTQQYLINRSAMKLGTKEEPIMLDEAIQQNIVWENSTVGLEDLNLDFRFNQVSFVLGQTDLKELFFAALMGLRPISSGNLSIEGTGFQPGNLSFARRYIGNLGDHDIFVGELTIFENLQFFGSLRDSSYTQYDSESSFVLSLLQLTSRKNNLPAVLTSRSARKLSLAVAAVGHTKLLLLVEPTLSLHWRPRCQVLNLLKKYKSIRSIVVDTSDVDEATAFGDRVLLLKEKGTLLDGSPARLTKQLSCGYWILFELAAKHTVQSGGKIGYKSTKSSHPSANLAALEKLTSDLFKEDKLQNLELTKRPIYREQLKSDGSQLLVNDNAQKQQTISNKMAILEGQHKTAVLLKVRHSVQSDLRLCQLLKLFANKNQHLGFILIEVTYESLEDILVLMMSKAIYPDLPPDLLLSLSHRTQSLAKATPSEDASLTQVSVHKLASDVQLPKTVKPVFSSSLAVILKNRASSPRELFIILISILVSLACVAVALYALQISLAPLRTSTAAPAKARSYSLTGFGDTEADMDSSSSIERLYRHRVGLYIVEQARNKTNTTETSDNYFSKWPGNQKITGIVTPNQGGDKSDASLITEFIHKSKDLAASLIFYNPTTGETTLVFEPQLTHAMISGIKAFNSYYPYLHNKMNNHSSKSNEPSFKLLADTSGDYMISRRKFHQPWHEMIHGHLTRRLFYGIGFAIAEGVAIGVLVIGPVRHRSESRAVRVKTSYWIAMAIFDLTISLVLISGYLALFVMIENTYSASLLLTSLLVFIIYKLASLPIAYLVSLVVESSLNGFLFILMIYITTGWIFSIHLKTFVDWNLISEGYQYTIASWVVLFAPISPLIDAQTDLNHIARMDALCPQVPIYTATGSTAPLDVPQKFNAVDDLLAIVQECLSNGKRGISTDAMNHGRFGVLWDIYLMIVFAILAWTFLLSSEKFFGIVARRFFSARTNNDPLKTIIRTSESSSSIYKWQREKDRLVSEYIRCINEIKYVKKMTTNCIYLRFWLRPLANQNSIDKKIALIMEPMIALGQPRNEIHVELKTTLQIFIRIGTEANHHKLNRVQLIERYSNFLREHGDIVVKFAIVDWTREMLYKILLHGRYNTQSTSVAS